MEAGLVSLSRGFETDTTTLGFWIVEQEDEPVGLDIMMVGW